MFSFFFLEVVGGGGGGLERKDSTNRTNIDTNIIKNE